MYIPGSPDASRPMSRFTRCRTRRHIAGVLPLAWLWLIATAANASLPPSLVKAVDHRAGALIYLDFWASWCGPCAESFPWLNDLRQQYRDRLVVVGVNVDTQPADARAFLAKHPASFPIVYDTNGELAARYAIQGMPSGVLIDRDGKILAQHSGFLESSIPDYDGAIDKALAQVSGRGEK